MSWKCGVAAVGVALSCVAGTAQPASAEDRETDLRASEAFPELRRGDLIRVRLRAQEPIRARFAAAYHETLFVVSDRALRQERGVSLTDIDGIDRRDGTRGHWIVGALLGLVAGAGGGLCIRTDRWARVTER